MLNPKPQNPIIGEQSLNPKSIHTTPVRGPLKDFLKGSLEGSSKGYYRAPFSDPFKGTLHPKLFKTRKAN